MSRKILSLVLVTIMTLSVFCAAVPVIFVQGQKYCFTTTLIAPTNNPIRVQHAQLIANELPKIGIGTNLLLVGWDAIIRRTLLNNGHADYMGGGFDLCCMGFSSNPLITLYPWFHTNSESPSAFNYYWVNNATLDGLIELTMNTVDFDQRKDYFAQCFEMVYWEIMPETTLYQPEIVVYARNNVMGYDTNRTYPPVEEWYFSDGKSYGHGQKNEIIFASTSRPDRYLWVLSNNYYNTLAIYPTDSPMVGWNKDFNYVPQMLTELPYPIAIRNNFTGEISSTDPNTATVWETTLRQDMYWHEGYGYTMEEDQATLNIDADDVVFTWETRLDPDGPTPHVDRAGHQLMFGADASRSVIKKDKYTVQWHIKEFNVDLMKFFANILPEHILRPGTVRKDGTVAEDYADWETSDWFNGKRSSGDTAHPAVIGAGPYIFGGENITQRTVTLIKNPYWFNKDLPVYANMPDKYIYTWIANKDAALLALEKGDIDIMDAQFHAEQDYPVMKTKPGIKVYKTLDWGCQTLGINIVKDAGGNLTNLYVRLAIAHMMPRQDMVDYLLGGLGRRAFVHYPLQGPFYPDDLEPQWYNLTKALDFMELAGYNMEPYRSISAVNFPAFEVLAFFIAIGGMAVVVLVDRHKKRSM